MEPLTIIIETAKNSHLKFDYDKKLQCFKLNKALPAGMVFPFDFGFIPNTSGDDGDPLDIIAISEFVTITGCAMDCRIVGAILAEQTEKHHRTIRNDRFIGIPLESEQFKSVREVSQLPKQIITQVQDFFINYNKEAGKKFKILDIVGSQASFKLIKKASIKKKTHQII
ncbi:MAG: hypothetical protein JWR61_4553 [Ferruginibacter sp.]|uniref:inorganic diphosphatase n=1 Tax=Ferruginibacter sp. TaxID=1940288 RepID=UPI002658856D|nr:inorganic diphosphatase [Ferruginibacter sp.]MDB5279598.1 hypothetical protein [Ferruginibacter sp.]